MRTRMPLYFGLFTAIVASLGLACGDDSQQQAGSTTGTGAAGGSGAFGSGGCRSCIGDKCASAIASCQGDPGCAAWLQCLDGCGVGENGDADPSCESKCQVSGSAATSARDGLNTCRHTGAGATCTACGETGMG